jgi:site-specific recombinase XerC
MSSLAPTLQAFFTQRLAPQRQASAHSLAAYRDCFRLLLDFLQRQTGKAPSRLGTEDLSAAVIGAFLEHLENDRGNIAFGLATRVWLRCIPSSASPLRPNSA